MQTLDQHRLKSLLNYDPETGVFTWLARTDRCKAWNRNNTGRIAGWIVDENSYVAIGIDGKKYYAHRLAWLYMTGETLPVEIEIDHKNRVRGDNRWTNLRKATKAQNGHNRDIQSNNTSGIKGVSWDSARKKWMAMITVGGEQTCLGRFIVKEDAIAARREAEHRLHGNFAVIKGVA